MIQTGLDLILHNHLSFSEWGRIGLVVNQSSVASHYEPTIDVIYQRDKYDQLKCIFGPQHGYYQTEQDNMKETEDQFYRLPNGKKIPLLSLYSQTREPLKEHFDLIDTLVIDLQDIGCRIYTYMLTMAACLRAASLHKKKVVILDRPNPIGLALQNKNISKTNPKKYLNIEGHLLDPKFHSFVGWYDIPFRHGLTMGELGNYFIEKDHLTVDYEIIPCTNLKRNTPLKIFQEMPWAMPSPNIPTWTSSFLFPAFVTLEATNISEGRGTTLPFQLVGAPWMNAKKCIQFLIQHKKYYLYDSQIDNSIFFRPHQFRPTFNKHHNEICNGLQIHIFHYENIHLYNLGLLFLYFCKVTHPKEFSWKEPGYEYNFEHLPIHLILGNDIVYHLLEDDNSDQNKLKNILNYLKSGDEISDHFYEKVQKHLIYN